MGHQLGMGHFRVPKRKMAQYRKWCRMTGFQLTNVNVFIYVAHRREDTSNAVYAPVRCRQKRLQMLFERVLADGLLSYVVWRVPRQPTGSHR